MWKDSKSKTTTQAWTFIEVFLDVFFLGLLRQSRVCKGLRRDGSCDSGVPLQLPQISLRPSMYGRNGRWRSWIFSLLGRPSKRLFPREVRPWPILSKKTFWRSLISFWFQTRTCSRLGWGFLVDAVWGTLPVPKETTQITSSSQPQKSQKSDKSDNTNHIQPIQP